MQKRMKIVITISSLLYILGAGYIFTSSLSKKADIAIGPAIKASIALSSRIVKVRKDIYDKNTDNTITLTAKVTNNTPGKLTGVKLVIPLDTNVGTSKTHSVTRIINVPGQGPDSIFGLPNIPSRTSIKSQVLLYARKKGTYTIKPYIDTNEKYIGTIDTVVLSAE